MIKARIDHKDVSKKLKGYVPELRKKLILLMRIHGRLWQSNIRKEYFTSYAYGKKSGKLMRRTEFMMGSIKPTDVKESGTKLTGGINFGAKYSSVHVGPKSKITTIKGKSSKGYLTIPLEGALTAGGEARGKARDANTFVGTFIQRSKRGNLIIFGKRVAQRGVGAQLAKGPIVPLFLLKKQVRIKTRIHPEEILPWARDQFLKDLKQEVESKWRIL